VSPGCRSAPRAAAFLKFFLSFTWSASANRCIPVTVAGAAGPIGAVVTSCPCRPPAADSCSPRLGGGGCRNGG